MWIRFQAGADRKRIHMLVYLAYALLVAHVMLGALQADRNIVLAVLLGVGLVLVTALHLLAGAKERAVDRAVAGAERDGFVEVCAVDNIPEKRAKVVSLGTERVAVFRYDG